MGGWVVWVEWVVVWVDLEVSSNDPEMMAAFLTLKWLLHLRHFQLQRTTMKYQGNPKVMALVTKMASKMGG